MGRRLLVILAASLAAQASAAAQPGAPDPLGRALARALTVPHVRPSASGALAVDLSSGATVFSQNGTLSLVPASNEKLAVAYTALVTLRAGFRIETQVLGEGQLVGSTWRGDLVLKGYGDPTLSAVGLHALASQVRAAGIDHVAGRVIGDESWFDSRRIAPGWKPSFYVNESPPLSALVVDRGRVHGASAPDPPLAAAAEFRTALRGAGVAVSGPAATGQVSGTAYPLAALSSPTLATLVRTMDHESDNFTAEMLLKELGAVESGRGTTAAGAAVVTRVLASAAVPLAGVRIVDGSGLSPLDRLTPVALVSILEAAWRDPLVKPVLLGSLPVAGESGTLQDRMRRPPARGNVVAKTGTTDVASALSGFVKGRFVFAVLQNGHPLPYWWARVAQDRFAQVLAAQ